MEDTEEMDKSTETLLDSVTGRIISAAGIIVIIHHGGPK